MDIKAMAKSKRSHTQHNHPKKPHQPSKPTSTASAATTNKQFRERKKGAAAAAEPSLPSNWGRYRDEDMPTNSGSDDPAQLADVDVVKPKSKGADYTTLIAQARESPSYYSPSFDDKLPDLYQGVAPMLAFRGEQIFLQDRDDDFLMEDEGRGTEEAPFLTLDLKDLAERLSKVNIAKRLFMEPDLFPQELLDQDENNAATPVESAGRHNIERIDSFGQLLALYLEEERMAVNKGDTNNDSTNFSSICGSPHVPEQDSIADSTETKLNDLGKSTLPKSESVYVEFLDKDTTPQFSHTHEQDARHPSKFELASAEAELDILLNSFDDTKIFETPSIQAEISSSYNLEHVATHGALLNQPVGQSKPGFPVTSILNDELDDLLNETSNINSGKHVLQPMTQVLTSSSSQPKSKPKDLDDFDSWMDSLS